MGIFMAASGQFFMSADNGAMLANPLFVQARINKPH
jgi:hypothetical protein